MSISSASSTMRRKCRKPSQAAEGIRHARHRADRRRKTSGRHAPTLRPRQRHHEQTRRRRAEARNRYARTRRQARPRRSAQRFQHPRRRRTRPHLARHQQRRHRIRAREQLRFDREQPGDLRQPAHRHHRTGAGTLAPRKNSRGREHHDGARTTFAVRSCRAFRPDVTRRRRAADHGRRHARVGNDGAVEFSRQRAVSRTVDRKPRGRRRSERGQCRRMARQLSDRA